MAVIICKNSKAAILIELLMVMAIFVIVIVSLFSLINLSLKIASQSKREFQANFLAQEVIEGIRSIKDRTDWDIDGIGTVVNGNSYHLEKSDLPVVWNLAAGSDVVNGFTENIVFNDAVRDVNKNIAETGIVDPNTKIVTITISWQDGITTKQVVVDALIANWVKVN